MNAADNALLDRLAGRGAELPALGVSVTRILAAIEDEMSNSEEIADLMASDPSIAARTLALANSTLYNPMGITCETLADAVARLGLIELRNVVVATGVIDGFAEVSCPFDYLGFWKHCLTTAVAAGSLAERAPCIERSGRPGENPYFIAGLLHDVGIFALVHLQGRRYSKVLKNVEAGDTDLLDVERAAFNVSHQEVGAALIRDWGLPEGVAIAAQYHHDPGQAPAESRSWAQVIHLADWIADHQGHGVPVEGARAPFAHGSWFDLGMDTDDIPEVIADFTRAAERSEMMLSLVKS